MEVKGWSRLAQFWQGAAQSKGLRRNSQQAQGAQANALEDLAALHGGGT
jgi:hypothetical protein